MSDSKKHISRRGFVAGAAFGAAAGISGKEALSQEFVSIGSLDDLPQNWWELPDFGGGGGSTTPDPDPTPDPVDPINPTPTPTPTPTIAVRQSIYALDPNGPEIASLRRGVAVMKQRGANDPTGWNYQARIHGFNRGVTFPPFGAPWGTCRHGANDFLSWHRMYLHFFERILRAASGDPTLALPYWNYSVPGQNVLPAAFRFPADNSNSLFEFRRAAAMNGGAPLSFLASESSQALQSTRFSRPFFSQALENRPHNIVHVEIGGPGGAMTDPVTAGEDPIFWLHHSNIDRLWNRWIGLGGGRRNPTEDPVFMGTPFSFVDETGGFVSMTGAEVLDSASQLEYRYDDDPLPPAGIDSTPDDPDCCPGPLLAFAEAVPGAAPEAVSLSAAPTARALAAPQELVQLAEAELASDGGGGLQLGGRRSRTRLEMAPPPPAALAAPSIDARTGLPDFSQFQELTTAPEPGAAFRTDLTDTEAQPVLLQLEEIDFEIPPGIWYAIYVNLPDDVEPDPRGPFFAGTFAPFAQNASGEPEMIDITALINRQVDVGLFDGGEISVEFVPSEERDDLPTIDIGRVRIIRP